MDVRGDAVGRKTVMKALEVEIVGKRAKIGSGGKLGNFKYGC